MAPPPASPARRLLRHVPVRVRHYWKLLVVCAAFVSVLTVVFSSVRVHPYVTSASEDTSDDVTQDIAGTVDLFDATVAHSVKLSFQDANYQEILDAYYDEDEKEYLEADLIIDGVTIPSVGIRLKGNSTLGQLTRNGVVRPGGFGGPGAGGARPQGARPPAAAVPSAAAPSSAVPSAAAPSAAVPSAAVPSAAAGGAAPAPARAGGGEQPALETEKPETLPWLIRFDEFVEGRRYEGHREVAVRVGGDGGTVPVLNEALVLSLLASSGEIAPGFAYSSFTVNDRPTTARLIVEHPDENFADELPGSGVLYKSLSTSQFTDQGDDPVDYEDDFKQINLEGSQDLQPVIDLVQWANNSSDAEFNAHLADYIDVASFARYVAMQNLAVNFDDMGGPGHNYYLRYDLATKKFTVIGWDYNFAFSGVATQDPLQPVAQSRGGGGKWGGAAPPAGAQPAAGAQPPAADEHAQAGGFGGGREGNKLKERFLASSTFASVYQDAYRDLYQEIFASGRALTELDAITEVLGTVDGVDLKAVADTATPLRTLIQQRTDFLAANPVIKQG
jgi:spore coat protein CotH